MQVPDRARGHRWGRRVPGRVQVPDAERGGGDLGGSWESFEEGSREKGRSLKGMGLSAGGCG